MSTALMLGECCNLTGKRRNRGRLPGGGGISTEPFKDWESREHSETGERPTL